MSGNTTKMTQELPTTVEAILDSISDGVFTVDEDWRVTSFNRAAEDITGIKRQDAINKPCYEVLRASMCEADCALRHTMQSGKPVINKAAFIVAADGRRIPVSISTSLLRDDDGRIIGGAETFRDLSLVEELRKEIEGRFQIGDIVSRSAAMRRIFDIMPQVAASDSTVLIQGETGTGKELLAHALHNMSRRASKPFIALNCGALPDNLLESELFGYKKGAFTGAQADKPGRFALAEGGTLFLDEIGDISKALQVRLLRVLEEMTYEPLGGTSTVHADVRIIAATNSNLSDEVREGRFRRDLFYRVNVVRIELPPLRKRREDIPVLTEHFINSLNRKQGKSISGVHDQVMLFLMAHDYPGNVRELENIIEHAFVLCDKGLIEPRHLPEAFAQTATVEYPSGDMKSIVHAAEKQALRQALEQHNYNRQAAARALGLHKSTFFRKIKALGIVLPRRSYS